MNDKVNELVESHYKVMHLGWLLGEARMGRHITDGEFHWLVREATKDYLSHPDLYLRDYDIEVAGLDDLYEAFISLAEEAKK